MALFRNIIKWLLADKPNNLLTITLALLASMTSYLASGKQINSLKNQIDLNISNKQFQSQTLINTQLTEKKSDSFENIQGKTTSRSFRLEDWKLARDIVPDKDGFYCPYSISFPGWFMWTKDKYEADKGITITFQLFDKTDDNKNATLYFSYGDKSNNAPDSYYRLNILDGDLNTIRLYDRRSREIIFERSAHEASIDNYLTIKIAPVFLKTTSSILLLNPMLLYQADGLTQNFEPKKEFRITLPFPSKTVQGQGGQYGIGVSAGDCFKLLSYEF